MAMEQQNKEMEVTEQGTPVPEVMKRMFIGSLINVLKFQDGETEMKKKFGQCLNQLQTGFHVHEERARKRHSFRFLEAGSLYFERENREQGRLFTCRLTFKQLFEKVFGTSWTVEYCAVAP